MTQHARFLERLAASWPAVFAVARDQLAKGRTVEIPPIRMAPSAAEAADFVDEGDLSVVIKHRLEVKGLKTIKFTGADDYPYAAVMFSNVATVDRARGSVMAYVVVSADLRYAAIVHA